MLRGRSFKTHSIVHEVRVVGRPERAYDYEQKHDCRYDSSAFKEPVFAFEKLLHLFTLIRGSMSG